MKLKSLLTEKFNVVSINGIVYSLTNDEKSLYDDIKNEKKLLKNDLEEFEQRLASILVSRGLLSRCRTKQGETYFKTRGRRKNITNIFNTDYQPPDADSKKWVSKNEEKYKTNFGKDYKKKLYDKAWEKYNGKK